MVEARELWIELMARLAHTLQECGQPGADRRLREAGVRAGTGTALRHLSREYAQAARMAAVCGVELKAQEVAERRREQPLRDDLDHDFQGLAATYQQLLLALAPESGSQCHQWLAGRARVHAAQAVGLALATHHGPPSIDLGGARDPPVAAAPQPICGCNLASASEPVLNRHQKDPK